MAKVKTDRPTESTSARSYHHGNLRQALLEAALELAQRHGPDRVSVREAARHVGVSPGAPFRHFPSRRALMTALAEEAGERLRIEVRKSMGGRRASPLQRLRSLGRGYLQWAMRHPSHFRIVSARDQIDLDGSIALRAVTRISGRKPCASGPSINTAAPRQKQPGGQGAKQRPAVHPGAAERGRAVHGKGRRRAKWM